MTSLQDRQPKTQDGRTLGWISGLGLPFAPWIVAGIISTFTPDPEAAFPLGLAVGFIAMAAWIGFGSWRIPGFRKGGLMGSAIALGVLAVLFGVLVLMQP
jgi:hypothetical protein